MKRTLIVHTGAIGDFLLACPAIQSLAEAERIALAGIRSRLDLAVAGKIAHTAHDLAHIDFHTVFSEPSEKLRAFLRYFDRAIVWMRDEDGAIRRGLTACGVAQVDVFPGLPDAQWTRHASEYYAECLGFRDLPPLRLVIPRAGPPLQVVMHPGSGSSGKNWPLENFLALAREHRACKTKVTWCLGPAEIEQGLLEKLDDDVLICDSLVELAARLTGADCFVGNDSGITHLAAAMGVPTVAVFGPTDPKVWAPQSEHVCVATGEPWPDVEEMFLLSS